jgi:myo-inositol catabolism protein IolH
MELGRGDVDADEAFAALAGIGFGGVLTTCVFGWDEEARESGVRMLDAIRGLVAKHFLDGTLAGAPAAGDSRRPKLPADTAPR